MSRTCSACKTRISVNPHYVAGFKCQPGVWVAMNDSETSCLSSEGEPSAGEVAALIRQMRQMKIQAVFVENITDPRLVQQLAREAGAIVGGTLFSDSLSSPDGPAPTYLSMFRHNAKEIGGALTK